MRQLSQFRAKKHPPFKSFFCICRQNHFFKKIMRAKKSYGQHFLHRQDVARRIATSLSLPGAYEKLIEVGPGTGMLTRHLLELPFELFVVEADPDMVAVIRRDFPELDGRILEADFLKADLETISGAQSFALIGNFPYNISSQILFKMLDFRHLIPEMVGMFQKEVAERVVAGPGSKTYGVISVLVQAYYDCKYLFGVDKSSFNPPPKVQSAVIRLVRKEQQNLGCDEALFREIVKTTFGQRRKMLRNTMKNFLPENPILETTFFTKRPEQLSLEDFIQLTKTVENQRNK